MSNLSFKVAVPVILAGIFIMAVIVAIMADKLDTAAYVIFILIAIYVFFFGFAVGQNFSSPVKKILRRATDLSEGDLSSRVYIESKDELGELARIFNKIAEELEQSRSQTESTEKSVDIKVRARTQALEETISALEQKVKNRTIELERMMSEIKKLQNEAKNPAAVSAETKPKIKKNTSLPGAEA